MRKLILLVLLLGLMAIGVGVAQAHVQGADIDYAFIDGSGKVLAITGTLSCTEGETYTLRVNLTQADGDKAIGRDSGTCTGSPQQWTTNSVETFGSFNTGPAAGHMQIRTSDGASRSISDKAQVVVD